MFFYHLKSVDCGRSDLWKSFGCQWKKWIAWFFCLWHLSSGVISRAIFVTFLQLPKYVLRICALRCFKLLPGILYGDIFLFACNLSCNLYQVFCKVLEVWFKKHALKLFQYRSVLFDNLIQLNSDLKAVVEMTWSNISPQLHAKLLNCQATSCTSFSMLHKLLAKNRHFSLGNVWKHLAIYVNKSLE